MAQITTHTLNALDGTHASNVEIKLSCNGAEVFGVKQKNKSGVKINYAALSFQMPDKDGQYHIPVIMSPNGCSFWWSG